MGLRSRFASNRYALASHWRRGRRRMAAAPPVGIIAASAAIGLLLVLFAAFYLDAASVGWARGLSPGVRNFARALTDAGQAHWTLVPSGLVLILFLAGDWRGVASPYRLAWLEVAALAVFIFVAVAGSGLFVDLIKLIVGRGRPARFTEWGAFSFSPFSFGYIHASFPSGHSTTTGALCVVLLTLPFGRAWRMAVVLAALLLASTRVLVGAHYPSDVAAGLMIGGSFAYVVALLMAGSGFALRSGERGLPQVDLRYLRRVLARPGGNSRLWGSLRRAVLPVRAGAKG